MSLMEISCGIANTDANAALGIEIWIDDQCVFDQSSITDQINWRHSMPDDDGEHEIRWVLKNKTPDHTQIDQQGNIIKDACVTITDVRFNDIELGHIFNEKSSYHHDFNGTQTPVTETFYGTMGCNGWVSLKFTTPIYLWLLEHL